MSSRRGAARVDGVSGSPAPRVTRALTVLAGIVVLSEVIVQTLGPVSPAAFVAVCVSVPAELKYSICTLEVPTPPGK